MLHNAIRSKKAFTLIFFGLVVFSIFGYVLPNVFYSEDTSSIETLSYDNTHPLTGVSDNVVYCSNDNSELHEIYLCGATDVRNLDISISGAKQYIWYKLDDTSCSASQTNCPNTSSSCTWNQLATTPEYTISEGGEYRIFVQYADDTMQRFYFNVYANGLNPNAVVTNIDCGNPGNITINNIPNGYEFSINNGASWQDSNVFPISTVSTYTIKIRNKILTEGCVFILNDIDVKNNSFNASTTILPITCNTSKGGIKIDLTDASSSYIYEISQGGNLISSSGPIANNTYTFNNLDSGEYNINVSLSSVSNCSWTANSTLPVFEPMKPNVVVTKNIDCSAGIITVAPTGGSSPYEFSLDGGTSYTDFTESNKTTISIPTNGSYTITLKDNNGCEVKASPVVISTEPEITYTLTPKNIGCNATNDGSIIVAIPDTHGYAISYSLDGINFQNSNVFSNLNGGDYTIIIRKEKAGGICDLTTSSVHIDESPIFTASSSVTQEIDCTNGSASIIIAVTEGGTAPFEYSINGVNFQTNTDFTGLGSGSFTVTVKDVNGCTTTVDQEISGGSNPSQIVFTAQDIDCATGETDIKLTIENGKAPFTYTITAPTIINTPSDTFLGLAPNTYTFEVIADDGCKIVRNFTVPNPVGFGVNTTVINNVSCFAPGTADGSIEVSVTDYITSFDVIVEDSTGSDTGLGIVGATSSPVVISGLAADTYTILVNDANSSCQKTKNIEIKAPTTAITIDSFDITHLNCGSTGGITIEASGGWSNYTFALKQPDNSITSSQSNKRITGLTQVGTYTILVTDINGCVNDTETFVLEDRGGPLSIVDASASNYCYSSITKGSLKIDVSDGIPPYFYTVNNGTPQPITGGSFTLTDLTPDNYIVKVIGNNGCETIVDDTKISGQLFAIAQITKPLGCGASPDAIIQVQAEEGYPDPDYNYEVSTDGINYSSATMPFSTSSEATYTFRVTDSKGCVTITDPIKTVTAPALSSSHVVSNTACGLEGTGSVELVGSGGTPPFLYSFDGSPYTTKTLYTELDATTYSFGVKDALGCELTGVQVVIGAEATITADVTSTDITCAATGGTQWGNTNVNNIQNATGLVTIRLIRVSSPAAHLAGTARYWTYREYNNVDMATRPSGYNIRMYWPHHFYVEIEDEKGCVFQSDLYNIEQPPFPWVQKPEVELEQSCASGASFQVEVGDPVGLVGPFKYRIWPYDENNPPSWRSFEDASENLAFGEDVDPNGIERDLRVNGLLFGVRYAIVLFDENTGCQRWRSLGTVHNPEAPNTNIDVVSTPQSLTCKSGADGRVKFTIAGSGDNDLDGLQTVNWSIRHTSDRGAVHDSHSWIPSFRQNGTANDGGSGGDIEIDLTGLKYAWYVVEVSTEAGCRSGNRFLISRPRNNLTLEIDQYVTATCNIGAQISVTAKGGWDNKRYYDHRNKIEQTWHEYEYAFVLEGSVPVDSDFGPDKSKTITPTAYDGVHNIYQVYVRDGGNCVVSLDSPITITKDDEPVLDVIDVTNRCTATNEIYDVTVSLTNLGINPINSTPKYIWDGEVTDLATKQLGPGTHELEVRDENGCSFKENIFIYPQMVSKSNITQVEQCSPINSGEVTIEVYGGSTDYSFTQTVPAGPTNTTGVFTGLTHSINYEFTVTDNLSNCAVQTVFATLDVPKQPNFKIQTIEHITCNGADNGKIIVEQIPATENVDVAYEYSIDGSTYQISNVFENLPPGPYNVHIKSSKNCVQTLATETIIEPSILVLDTPTVSPFSCNPTNGLGLATISTNVNGGTAPFNYSFNGTSFSTTNSFSIPFEMTQKNVIIDVIDVNGCTDQIAIIVPAATKVTADIIELTVMDCITDASIRIDGIGGSGNYSIKELPSGNLINGTGTGNITLAAGNPGTYIYELTDMVTGCTVLANYVIDPFDTIEVIATSIKDISCFGDANGEISFISSGFTTAFNYEIYNVNNLTTPIIPNTNSTSNTAITNNTLAAGTYFVTVTDSNTGCSSNSNQITIQSPIEAIDFTTTITNNLSCSPGADAQVTAEATGGWGTYEYQLVDPSIATPIQSFDVNNIFSGLQSGINYELTIKDIQGCNNVMKVFTIPVIDPIVINPASITTINPSCTKNNDASISVVASRVNGPANYQYILNNETTNVSGLPQDSSTFNNLIEGDYSVTVIDGFGCDITTATISIIDPSEVKIDGIISKEPNCAPNSGEITVSASGGGGTYEYRIIAPLASATSWNTQNVFPLGSGTYEFEAKDAANLCIAPISVIRTINEVAPLAITVNSDNTMINCFGETDAVLIAEANGGLGGYLYQLEVNGTLQGVLQVSGTFKDLGQGSYRIFTTGGTNCEIYSEVITISEPTLLTASVSNKQDIKCFGEEDGSIEINVTGGNAPYQYIISSSPEKSVDTNVFNELPGGTYSVIVQDANGCEIILNNIEIETPLAALSTSIKVEDEVCSSDNNGIIEITITGGTAPYAYNLTGPSDSFTQIGSILILDNLDGGFYSIFIKDAKGCSIAMVEEVKVGSDLSANVETITECLEGNTTYSATVTFNDTNLDTTEIVYDLDDALPNNPDITNSQSNTSFSNISSGNHTISIVHLGTGCVEVLNFTIDRQEPLKLISKAGKINEIIIEASGGDGQYTYYIDDQISTGSMFINHTDVYTAKVVDGKGCETTIEITMEFIDIEIPNYFTPNGDGQNDEWEIKYVEGFPNLWVAIYDRQGRQLKYIVKQGTWDGSYNNTELPTGDYWYIIKLNGENDKREFVGHVTIYR